MTSTSQAFLAFTESLLRNLDMQEDLSVLVPLALGSVEIRGIKLVLADCLV